VALGVLGVQALLLGIVAEGVRLDNRALRKGKEMGGSERGEGGEILITLSFLSSLHIPSFPSSLPPSLLPLRTLNPAFFARSSRVASSSAVSFPFLASFLAISSARDRAAWLRPRSLSSGFCPSLTRRVLTLTRIMSSRPAKESLAEGREEMRKGT